MVPIWSTIRLMSPLPRSVPIMTDLRQAREASMERTLEGRQLPPLPGSRSSNMNSNSSTSLLSNWVNFEKGTLLRAMRFVGGAGD